jgi:plastocyanin
MTYTHKLARRLAISRKLGMSTAFALLAACAGDTTAPEAPASPNAPSEPASPSAPLGFRVLPGSITIEVNQRIRFRGELRGSRDGLRVPPMRWEATGGTITSDGTFSASRAGTYKVIGRSRIHRPDTSVVVVVPRQPTVERVRVTPRTPRVVVGKKRTFTAVGRLGNGTNTAIKVNWSATGGTIDAAGNFVAGDTPGTYAYYCTLHGTPDGNGMVGTVVVE